MPSQKEARFDFFISHSSDDKAGLVDELALKLSNMGYRVWYDVENIVPGDSLIEEIGDGLKQSEICILVISHSFLSRFWTVAEYKAAMVRHIERKMSIIPVWVGVTKDDVARFSPFLSDIAAIDSRVGMDCIAEQIARARTKQAFEASGIFSFQRKIAHKQSGRMFLENRLTDRFIDKKSFGLASVGIIDIDDMTKINKMHGDLIGDDVLTLCEIIISDVVSGIECDYGQCGDDTFYVILYGPNLMSAHRVYENIRSQLEAYEWDNESPNLRVSCSVGTAMRHDFEEGVDVAVRAAIGMQTAKTLGGKRVCEGPERLPHSNVAVSTFSFFS